MSKVVMPDHLLNILLVDDHDLFRTGLRMIIESLPDTTNAVHEASSGEDCIAVVREQPIDIVFMDYSLPELNGVSTSLRLLQIKENLKIIILTGHEYRPVSRVIMQAGISGYMTKSSAKEEVSRAIGSVMEGGIFLSDEIAQQIALDSLRKPVKKHPLDNLSRRELQVALLLMGGHKPTAVGTMLFLSPKSVSTYKTRAFQKLNVDTLVELVELGWDSGFLSNYNQRDRVGESL